MTKTRALVATVMTGILLGAPIASSASPLVVTVSRWLAGQIAWEVARPAVIRMYRTSCGPGCRTKIRVKFCNERRLSGHDCVRALKKEGLW